MFIARPSYGVFILFAAGSSPGNNESSAGARLIRNAAGLLGIDTPLVYSSVAIMAEKVRRVRPVSEQEARRVAGRARETEWQAPCFLKEIFLGNFRLDLVHPFPEAPPERPEFRAFYDRHAAVPARGGGRRRDRPRGKIPPRVVEGSRRWAPSG